ncbi:MAG: chitobiase/beta-hexosaminidase C-terminal domain-containing protein [Fibrobacterota bacterium]|nr:MAG: chitobiase/beta-hexosaminidase C-terminal domain-containing protein [Fibrobacterota bacterium]
MIPRKARAVRCAVLGFTALTSLFSCQSVEILEESPSDAPGSHYVHFRVADSASSPDSLWYRSKLDSGSESFSVQPDGVSGLRVRLFPFLHQIGDRDSMAIHCFRLGLHTGISFVKQVNYMELSSSRMSRTGPDSLAVSMLRTFDSLRKASPEAFKDTSAAGKRAALQQAVAEFVFRGNPSTDAYKRYSPIGLDTASLNRQILTLAAKSGLTLGEVVKQWNLALDYPSARRLISALTVDSSSLNPFQQEVTLHLDTLRPGEAPVGLVGRIRGKMGIKNIEYVVENDSGIRTDRFILADFPDLKANPERVDFATHPTFVPRVNARVGTYTLRVNVLDNQGNEQSYFTPFQVAPGLDHTGPDLAILEPTSSVVRDYSDSTLLVKVDVTDPSGVKSVKIGGKEAPQVTNGIWSLTIVVPLDSVGRELEIEALDSANNPTIKKVLVRRDRKPVPTPPRLKLVAPANGTWIDFKDSTVRVAWKAETDFGTVDSVTIDGVQAKLENGAWVRELTLPANGRMSSFGARAYSSVDLVATEYVLVGRKADSAGPLVEWAEAANFQRVSYDIGHVDVSVTASDLSGVDSVHIGGSKVNPSGRYWRASVSLAGPGELTRIVVEAWDHAGNQRDTAFVVSRDQIPGQLPPSLSWRQPSKAYGTVIPFAERGYLVQCVLTDISGIDSASVKIGGQQAKPINDSVWERLVDLPPDGKPQVITLEAKNKRGISISGFVSVAREMDVEKPTITRWATTQDMSVAFDTASVEVGWTAKDNDRLAQAWIQDSLVTSDVTGYHRRVPLAITTQWLKFRAVDPAGNEVRDSVRIERRTDTVKSIAMSDTNSKLRSGTFWVKLSCATPGAAIRYTLDGSDPKSTSPIYADSIRIDTTITLKARGFAPDRIPGLASTQQYLFALAVEVGAGTTHSLVRMSDGSLWGFGDNNCSAFITSGGCGRTMMEPHPEPVKFEDDSVLQVSASANQSFWVKADGSLWAIGGVEAAGLGIGTTSGLTSPLRITGGVSKVRNIGSASFILKSDGSLWGTGNNLFGQIGAGDLEFSSMFVKVADDVVDMGGGNACGYFIKRDQSLWATGRCSALSVDSKVPVKAMDSVASIPASAGSNLIIVRTDGTVWGGGENSHGELGLGHTNPVEGLVRLNFFQGKTISKVSMGYSHVLVLDASGTVYGMGLNAHGELGPVGLGSVFAAPLNIFSGMIDLSAGSGFSLFVAKDGAVMSAGTNISGQLGRGAVTEGAGLDRVRF